MGRRLIWICTLGAVAGIFLCPFNPVNSTMLKSAFLVCVAGAWLGCTALTWKRKPLRVVLLILPMLAGIPFILPGGEIDENELRQDYVWRMVAFEGTPYYWGGENSQGIDCSGLPRRAFRDALLAYGARHCNGCAFRSYLQQWWFDASARALGQGYRNYARPVGIAGTIQEMDYRDLLPGDLAVTTSGVHVLAYVGEGRWIQADPGGAAVVTLDGRTGDNTWFLEPVTIHRWQLLAPR